VTIGIPDFQLLVMLMLWSPHHLNIEMLAMAVRLLMGQWGCLPK
jgi:hypothetical protein